MLCMDVVLSNEAKRGFREAPGAIKIRIAKVLERLKAWPEVSGAKSLRGELHGSYRVRTGDWRIVFRVTDHVLVVRIDNRRDVYES